MYFGSLKIKFDKQPEDRGYHYNKWFLYFFNPEQNHNGKHS